MLESLEPFLARPLLLLLLLFLLTFLLEDLATTTAAVLVAEGLLPLVPALVVILSGIVLGDYGLYGLGVLARRWQRLKAWYTSSGLLAQGAQYLSARPIVVTLSARFIPGARLPAYTGLGLFGASFRVFALTVGIAVTDWTGLLFFLVLELGEQVATLDGPWRWFGLICVLALGLFGPRLLAWLWQQWRGTSPSSREPESPDC